MNAAATPRSCPVCAVQLRPDRWGRWLTYCSRACAFEARRPNRDLGPCPVCGEPLPYRSPPRTPTYCSRACAGAARRLDPEQRRAKDRARRAAAQEKYRERDRARRPARGPLSEEERARRNALRHMSEEERARHRERQKVRQRERDRVRRRAGNPNYKPPDPVKRREYRQRWAEAHPEKARAEREKNRRRARRSYYTNWAATVDRAARRGQEWTGPELEIVARPDLSARAAALMTGRTYQAVLTARKRLRLEPRYSLLAGLAGRVTDE